jgi:curved DNA binding protein
MATTEDQSFITNQSIFTKYQAAADICNRAMEAVIAGCVDGAKVIDLCKLGDKTIEEEAKKVYSNKKSIKKGIAFPTCVSPADIICHVSPLDGEPDSEITLKTGDMVRIELASHVDGYIAHSAHTLKIGATKENPASGREGDVIEAAHQSCEAILRLLRNGKKSYEITDTIQKLTEEYECVPIEGMISHAVHQDNMEGEKTIMLNPTYEQRRQVPEVTLEEGDAYVIDVLITTSDGKLKPHSGRTTVYKKNVDANYQLKLKASKNVYTEIINKFGNMGFSLRAMDDSNKAKLGITECQAHRLVNGYPMLETKEDEFVAHYMFTALMMPSGPTRITKDFYDASLVKADHEIKDEEINTLLKSAVKKSNKKKNKKKKAAAEAQQ